MAIVAVSVPRLWTDCGCSGVRPDSVQERQPTQFTDCHEDESTGTGWNNHGRTRWTVFLWSSRKERELVPHSSFFVLLSHIITMVTIIM